MTPSAIVESNEMATPSTFSYAQAAKGQGAAPVSNNSAPTNAVAPAQDTQAPVAVPVSDLKTATPAPEQATTAEVSEATESLEPRAVASEKQDLESVPSSESDARSESTQERRPESRRDDDAGRLDRPWRRNEKTPRSSSNTTRSTEEQDSRKARRGKKSKAAEKQPSEQAADKEQEAAPEPPKVELAEAPIPSVNIWHQRKEAHLAKAKPAPTPAEAAVNGTSAQKDDDKSAAKAEESTPAPYTNGVKPQQKAASVSRPERNGPRGSRISDKEGKAEVPPSVQDSTHWPTPETAITAIKEDKKKTVDKASDRSDRSDKDAQENDSQGKPRQKWVTYDYVPTVSFETQLPQMRGSKPRGGARSGRDASTRATTNGVTDKASSAPVNKSNDAKPRDGPNGTTSQPAAAKRGSLDAANGQKKASANAGADKAKDSAAQSSDTTQTPRDRPEGRGERGRGGYRGRGAHGNGQSQHQHSASATSGFHGQGAGAGRAQGHYSPPLRQGSHGGMFAPPTQRGRGGRNGAGNYHRLSLPNGSSRMPAVQAQFAAYDYSMAPMAGMPLQPHPYWDNMVMPMLKSQIEYYFSIENLCKDMYLRQRMDSQGFVPLHFITAFKRMRDLSADMNLIRAVCEDSVDVDYVVGEDDCERLRRREDWQKFVLPMEDRDELARNDGPMHLTFKNRSYNYANGHFNGFHGLPYGQHGYPVNAHDPSFQHFVDNTQAAQGVNGAINTNGVSQLSAEVPDFSPSGTVPLTGLDGDVSPTSKAEVSTQLQNGQVEAAAPLTNGVHAEHAQTAQS